MKSVIIMKEVIEAYLHNSLAFFMDDRFIMMFKHSHSVNKNKRVDKHENM